jgi:hypothetical protein
VAWLPAMTMRFQAGIGFEVAESQAPNARIYITTDDELQAELFARRLSWDGTRVPMMLDGILRRNYVNGQPEN